MKKWRKHIIIFLLLTCITGLIGCTRTRIIDKISIVHVFGFDLADNGDLVGTALFPEYTKSKDSDEIQYLSVKAPTGILLVRNMSEYTSTPVEISKIRVLLFGKNYAEEGIQDMVDRFIINPQVGTNIQIAISTESAKETLNIFKEEKSLTLADRLRHNMERHTLPNMNLHVFLNHFYGEGMDAYVPMVTTEDKNRRVKIDGLGIFKNNKLKLHLNPEQTIIFSLINDEKTEADYQIEVDESDRSENLVIRTYQSKSKWDWDKEGQKLKLNLQLEATLTHYPDRFNSEKPEDIRKLKKLITEKLEKDIDKLLALLKENEVDPIGLGNIVRSQDRSWKKDSFYELYPALPIQADINLEIIHSGLQS
ncbi:germination protein, Ger(x)C family [Gracilibacillus ureilyticus]|uniref:Germination protein, Ger(X)C family n=1 Tax=Gracilibacillus ureilyticus TaxID=531814 RepID=A0A1H9QZS4_9BACI|nr:Ger(x)C family spore germination protein [Gracilibacillus ureilyticus]SER65329.1 germination protein, Ger(x)C family [Gracilibacillus ureilyticus]